jgi:putative chitinase
MMEPADILRTVAPRATENYVAALMNGRGLLDQFEINTALRLSHFLAQLLHETAGGTVLFENLNYTTPARVLAIFGVGHHSAAIRPEEVPSLIGNPSALAERVYGLGNPRMARQLSNTHPGDGFRYRGGGALQTTGGGNYKKMGDMSSVDFYGNPDLIVSPEHALKPALNEWAVCKLNSAADKNDIRTITKAINGGYNGLVQRQAWFDRLWKVVNGGATAPDPIQIAKPDAGIRWLQQALNDAGAQPRVTVDGRYGPQTTAAVKWFQTLASVPVDGIAGDVTKAALKLRLSKLRSAAGDSSVHGDIASADSGSNVDVTS